MSGICATAFTSRFMRSTIAAGVLAGASTANQPMASKPLKVSATGGTFSKPEMRSFEVTAIAFSLPALMFEASAGTPSMVNWLSLVIVAVTAGPAPLLGGGEDFQPGPPG